MSEEKNIEPSADDSLQTTESENISEQQTKNYKLKHGSTSSSTRSKEKF